jgi:hypothetical protein
MFLNPLDGYTVDKSRPCARCGQILEHDYDVVAWTWSVEGGAPRIKVLLCDACGNRMEDVIRNSVEAHATAARSTL